MQSAHLKATWLRATMHLPLSCSLSPTRASGYAFRVHFSQLTTGHFCLTGMKPTHLELRGRRTEGGREREEEKEELALHWRGCTARQVMTVPIRVSPPGPEPQPCLSLTTWLPAIVNLICPMRITTLYTIGFCIKRAKICKVLTSSSTVSLHIY